MTLSSQIRLFAVCITLAIAGCMSDAGEDNEQTSAPPIDSTHSSAATFPRKVAFGRVLGERRNPDDLFDYDLIAQSRLAPDACPSQLCVQLIGVGQSDIEIEQLLSSAQVPISGATLREWKVDYSKSSVVLFQDPQIGDHWRVGIKEMVEHESKLVVTPLKCTARGVGVEGNLGFVFAFTIPKTSKPVEFAVPVQTGNPPAFPGDIIGGCY